MRPLIPKYRTKVAGIIFAIPETQVYTGFIRAHFEKQLLWNWLFQVRGIVEDNQEMFKKRWYDYFG